MLLLRLILLTSLSASVSTCFHTRKTTFYQTNNQKMAEPAGISVQFTGLESPQFKSPTIQRSIVYNKNRYFIIKLECKSEIYDSLTKGCGHHLMNEFEYTLGYTEEKETLNHSDLETFFVGARQCTAPKGDTQKGIEDFMLKSGEHCRFMLAKQVKAMGWDADKEVYTYYLQLDNAVNKKNIFFILRTSNTDKSQSSYSYFQVKLSH